MGKKIIVISGPSGVGKTTLYKGILKRYSNRLGFSVSATTRPMREGERDGVDYYFMSSEAFDNMVKAGGFLEWENNYGNCYGTLRSEINRIWQENKHCFLDLDVKGALNIQKQFPSDSVLIFIEPPSVDILTQRLMSRGGDENYDERLRRAEEELSHKHKYHYSVINSDIAKASEDLDRVLRKIL